MKMPRVAALALVLLTGCFGSRDPEPVRWFRPVDGPEGESAAPLRSDVPALRIRSVRALEHLRERIVHRDSLVEVGLYDDLRWTDTPAKLVQESLERELFALRAIPRAISERSAVLDIEVVSFEEVREGRHRSIGEVGLRARLGDPRDRVVLERSWVSRTPIARPGDGVAIAAAIRTSLAQVVHEIAESVLVRLGGAREPSGG